MSAKGKSHFRLGLIGPDKSQPCGIADYTARLKEAFSEAFSETFSAAALPVRDGGDSKCELIFTPIQKVFIATEINPELKKCDAVLVQYERSLFPNPNLFLNRLSQFLPERVFVAPHEVYETDPFAFPYEKIEAKFLPLLWLKQIRYRLRHRDFFSEKKLQQRGYFAHGVIPLSGPGFEILQKRILKNQNLKVAAEKKVLAPIPLASFKLVDTESNLISSKIDTISLFNSSVQKVIGIFGFLNPSLNYDLVFKMLKHQGEEIALLIMGGQRTADFSMGEVESMIANHGLQNRVKITGFIREEELPSYFSVCDFFISPMLFKSNTSSILNLLHLQKVILTSDLPICRYLKSEGAPIELYTTPNEFEKKIKAILAGEILPLTNQYPWSFEAVANAYLKAIKTSVAKDSVNI